MDEAKLLQDEERRRFFASCAAVGLGDTMLLGMAATAESRQLLGKYACEEIFTTLMGEDVESRRKFIEENALDVKNLDI